MALTKITGDVIATNTSITAVGATFTGNVSIAGTISYEDVTNVDSVGLITARSGINITSGGLIVTGVSTVSAGSTSAPSISPSGDTNTGIFFPSADTIAFGEGGAEAARIDSNGRFGLGTSSPGAPLHVVSNSSAEGIRLAGRSADNIGSFYFRNNADSATYGLIQGRSTDFRISSDSASQPITFHLDAEKMRLTSTGLGIGVTSPQAKLSVSNGGAEGIEFNPGYSSGVSSILAYNRTTSAHTELGFEATQFPFRISGIERARIDSSGRLLIGTSTATKNADRLSGSKIALASVGNTSYPSCVITGYSDSGSDAGPIIDLQKSRGASDGSMTVVVSGDRLGSINFLGADGTNFIRAVEIKSEVDGTPGTNDMPGRIIFSTTADGASTPTERMRLDSSGRLGIGNNAPGVLLDLGTATVTQGYIRLRSTGSGAREANIYSPAGGGLTIDTNSYAYPVNILADTILFGTGGSGTERARIDSSGRLLVGTTATTASVRAVFAGGDGAGNVGSVQIANTSNSLTDGAVVGVIGFVDSDHSSGKQDYASVRALRDGGTWSSTSKPVRLAFNVTSDGATSPTERMSINRNGQITSNPSDDGLLVRTAASAGTTNYLFAGNRNRGGSEATVCYIFTNGNIQNTNGSYTTISDEKLKENIVDAGSQWNDLKAIQIRNWNFKNETGYETHRQIGPVAQELEQVCPGLVFETQDRDADGNETGEVTKGVNQSVLYMKAVKALQEAMERIEQLEASNADLLARVTALES